MPSLDQPDFATLVKTEITFQLERIATRVGVVSLRRFLTSGAMFALVQRGVASSGGAVLSKLSTIERAKGVVMARTGCDGDHALVVLRAAVERSGRSIRDVAQELISRAAAGEYRGDEPHELDV